MREKVRDKQTKNVREERWLQSRQQKQRTAREGASIYQETATGFTEERINNYRFESSGSDLLLRRLMAGGEERQQGGKSPQKDSARLTDHAGHEAADLVGDLEDVRHRRGVDQPVLIMMIDQGRGKHAQKINTTNEGRRNKGSAWTQ